MVSYVVQVHQILSNSSKTSIEGNKSKHSLNRKWYGPSRQEDYQNSWKYTPGAMSSLKQKTTQNVMFIHCWASCSATLVIGDQEKWPTQTAAYFSSGSRENLMSEFMTPLMSYAAPNCSLSLVSGGNLFQSTCWQPSWVTGSAGVERSSPKCRARWYVWEIR